MKFLLAVNFMMGVVISYSLGVVYFTYANENLANRTEYLFVYGTLENPFVRTLMCSCIVKGESAVVPNFRQVGLTIVPDKTSSVSGQLFLLSPAELARLDRYENVPEKYRRVRIAANDEFSWVYIRNN